MSAASVGGKRRRPTSVARSLRQGYQELGPLPVGEGGQGRMRRPGDKIQGAIPQGLHGLWYRKQKFELNVQSLSFEAAQFDGRHGGKIGV